MDIEFQNLREGQVVTVVQSVSEGDKSRKVPFHGVIKKVRGQGINKTITVRQTLEGVDVDRIFLISSPTIVNISIDATKEKITKKIKRSRKQKGKK